MITAEFLAQHMSYIRLRYSLAVGLQTKYHIITSLSCVFKFLRYAISVANFKQHILDTLRVAQTLLTRTTLGPVWYYYFNHLTEWVETRNVESKLWISDSHVNMNKQKQSSEDRTRIRKTQLLGIRVEAAAVMIVDDVPHLTSVTLNATVVSIKRQLVATYQSPLLKTWLSSQIWGWSDLPHHCDSHMISMTFDWHNKCFWWSGDIYREHVLAYTNHSFMTCCG